MVGYFILMVAVAVALALWEIQKEGEYGWGKKLPTWRIKPGGRFITSEGREIMLSGYKRRLSIWIIRILGGRDLTGYHLYMVIFLVLIVHLPHCFFTPWRWSLESLLIGFLAGLFLIEDFLWFVLHWSPKYGIKNFHKNNPNIYWHPHWWGPVPDCYWLYAIAAGLLIFLGRGAI